MSNERNTESHLIGSALVNEAEGTQSMNQSSAIRGEGMGASRPERIQRKIGKWNHQSSRGESPSWTHSITDEELIDAFYSLHLFIHFLIL